MILPLEIQNLKKTYQLKSGTRVDAVKGISLKVEPGEVFGLLGPNGAGKTTIISSITTIEQPTSGEVLVFGQSVQKSPQFTKQNLGVVPQEIVTQGFFNLEEILKFHSGYYGIWDNRERIDYLFKKLNLTEHRKKLAKQLSGGMKRRLMIAKALVHRPKLLLLDEPTAGVDVELRTSLWAFVRELQQEGVSILLTTHYLKEAEELCSRVGIINKGSLIHCGPTQSIINELTQKTITLTLNQAPPQGALLSPHFQKQIQNNYVYTMPHQMSVGQLLLELKIPPTLIEDIKTQEGSLEDAFLSVLHKKEVSL